MKNENFLSELRDIRGLIKSDIYAILNNELRFQIISYLLIFNELSMSDLNRKLKRSKSTLHRHIKLLIELGFIELSKEKKVRGSIKAKYFKLTNKFLNLLDYGEKKLKIRGDEVKKKDNKIQDQIDLMKLSILINIKPLEILRKIIDFSPENRDLNYPLLLREIKAINPIINIMFLTKHEFKKLNEKLKEFNSLLNELEFNKKKQSNSELTPYLFTSYLLNLNSLLKINL